MEHMGKTKVDIWGSEKNVFFLSCGGFSFTEMAWCCTGYLDRCLHEEVEGCGKVEGLCFVCITKKIIEHISVEIIATKPPVGHPKWLFSKGIPPKIPLIQVLGYIYILILFRILEGLIFSWKGRQKLLNFILSIATLEVTWSMRETLRKNQNPWTSKWKPSTNLLFSHRIHVGYIYLHLPYKNPPFM